MRLRRVKRPDLGVPSSSKVQRGNTWTGGAFEFFCLVWTVTFSWRHSPDGWYSPVCLNAVVSQCSLTVGCGVTLLGEATEDPWRLKVLDWAGKLACIKVTMMRIEGAAVNQNLDSCVLFWAILVQYGWTQIFTPTWTFGFADILSTKKVSTEEVSFWGYRNVFVQSRSSSSITASEDEVNVD